MNNYEKIGLWLATVIALLFVTLLIGFPLKWVWNGVMPDVFGLSEITFWKACGMYFLFHVFLRGVTINEK